MTRVVSRSDFVAGIAGPLFRTRSWPIAEVRETDGSTDAPGATLPTVLLVAPIGEEMNRSRRFLAALRRECARRGAHVALVDPFGSGDSAGEFVEATWEIWMDDLAAAAGTLATEGGDKALTLLGLRSGCLLVDALSRRLDAPPARIVEIQPEHDGAAVVRRFLSTRVLAARFAGRKEESVSGLEARIAADESLELGGYEVSAALLRALGAAAIEPSAAPRATGRSHRFDLTESPPSDPQAPPVPVASDESGPSWRQHRLPSRPFWQLAESVPDPHVIARLAEVIAP